MPENESIKHFAEEYVNKAEFVKELMKPMPQIKIPPDPQIELTKEQNELIKGLAEIAKKSNERSTESRVISIAGLLIAILALAMQCLKG